MSNTSPLYIHGTSRISAGTTWKDEQQRFRHPDPKTESFLPALYHALQLNYPKWYKMDRLSQLGILAVDLLLKDSFNSEDYDPSEVAIVLSNSHSSLDTDARFVEQLADIPSPATFVYTLPNIMIGEIGIRHGFKGEQGCFVTAAPDVKFMEQYVQSLFAEGRTKRCITGWIDLFRDDYEAVLFLVGPETKDNIIHSAFNKENLYQYLYHEQGAVN
ncbi:hypothetical protein [Flavihumibacter solisilvae]|uniref:hypothetical protein n=1 Tax=Flavihumibacter solisilvae TaxID=1349421 RepID=UPI000691457E|nr:hypothetical protein [Flavihumibacter solisilvae]